MPSDPDVPTVHVVWDWNGTLLDDFDLTAQIARGTLSSLGVPGITGERIRADFKRPFSDFYASLFGRPVTDAEFAYIRDRYESEYHARLFELELQPDALEAMDLLATRGATQSLLSMAPDDQLQQLVDHHRIRSRLVSVEGNPRRDSDGRKAERLISHIEAIGADPRASVVIGDTVDDQEAAVAAGAGAVLVTTGSTSRSSLEATGAAVSDTLLEAARLAIGR